MHPGKSGNMPFNNIYHNKTVLITGNTGFKGSWLTTWLISLGAKVVGFSIDVPTTPSLFGQLNLESKIEHHFDDVTNKAGLLKLIEESEPDFVFHLAAQPIVYESYVNPLVTYQTNVVGTATVLDTLKNYKKNCAVIIVTSDKCYDNIEWTWGYRENDRLGGKDPYSASKAAAEIIFNSYFHSFFKNHQYVKIASVRAGNVIGGGDWAKNRIVPDIFKAWNLKTPVVIRSPGATRPWQHVLEPLSGYLDLAQNLYQFEALSGESFNFGPPAIQSKPVTALIDELGVIANIGPADRYVIENNMLHEAGLLKLNCDKAMHLLAWHSALNFEQTAKLTADWYICHFDNKTDIAILTEKQIHDYCDIALKQNIKWAI